MNYIIIAIIITTLLLLAILLNVNYKKVKQVSNNNELDYITKKLPKNKEICQKILSFLNRDIEIEEQPEFNNSLYIVLTDKIILGKMKIDSVKVQTIAHECVHSTQNRKILLSNFFLTNICNVYFIVSILLTIFGVFKNLYIQLYIITMLSILCFCIRNYLETDAMAKAEYLAEKYLESTELDKKEQKMLMQQYKEINGVGIPLVNYINVLKEMVKPLIYAILVCL